MSDIQNIGLIHNFPLPKDAIHIAIAQVSAGESLSAGDHVGFKEGETVVYKDTNCIGIVDPYLKDTVSKDRLFYLFLYPNTVTSLTHQWEHPSFNRTPEKIAAARKWLDDNGEDRYDDDDAYVYSSKNADRFIDEFEKGSMNYYALGDDFSEKYNYNENGFRKKFWDNLEIVTGKLATKEQRDQEYFTCSC